MTSGGAAEAIAMLCAGIDGLLDADLSVLSGADLAQCFAELETQRRRLDAVDHAVLAALGEHDVAGEFGRQSVVDLLGELARVAPAEATARVCAARDLGPRREFTGAPLAPIFARVAAAQHAGDISAAHARVIIGCVQKLPTHLSWEVCGPAQAFLGEHAHHLDPRQLAIVASRLLATLDPDGAAPREQDQQRRRGYGLRRLPDGRWIVTGEVTEEFAATWTPLIDALAAPQPGENGHRENGHADDRTPAQRRHDAMIDLGQRLLRSATLPDCGGTATTVNLGIGIEDLEARTGTATTDHGDPVTITTLLRLAGECELVTTVFDRNGAVLCQGRSRRLANRAQRRALAARDRGCSFPGCTRPASWTQAHHVIAWIDGGPTDIDNMCLLCGFHHREFERRGWTVHMNQGVPEWTPPAWLDPQRKPRRNTAHHLPDIDLIAGNGAPAAHGDP
jgi:hypothetical protein